MRTYKIYAVLLTLTTIVGSFLLTQKDSLPPSAEKMVVMNMSWAVYPRNLDELVAISDLIVKGTIAYSNVRVSNRSEAMFTDYAFYVTDVFKGPRDLVGHKIVVTQLGGEINGVKVISPSFPLMKVKDELILFLGKEEDDNWFGMWRRYLVRNGRVYLYEEPHKLWMYGDQFAGGMKESQFINRIKHLVSAHMAVKIHDKGLIQLATRKLRFKDLLRYVEYPVAEDAHVAEGYPDNSFGDTTALYIQSYENGYKNERIFLKFDLSKAPAGAEVASAKLYLYCWRGRYAPINVQCYSVENDSWEENRIAWNTQPALGELLDEVRLDNLAAENGWHVWNVTSFVASELAGDRVVSLCLKAEVENSGGQYAFESREWWQGLLRPYLEITYVRETP